MGQLLLSEMVRTVESSDDDAKIGRISVPSLEAAVHYLEDRHSKPIRLDELAKASGCCPSNVIRLFQKHLKTTPMLHLQRIRMEEAAHLLTTSRLRIGEIAEKVGIGDPFYFSRLFRRHFGITASAYREKHMRFP
jgi:transcriptional regulator GlxA family with amidase domain